jgi:hypothetical protein
MIHFLKGILDMGNTSTIKSYNKDYFVYYNDKTLSQIINENYEDNDFIKLNDIELKIKSIFETLFDINI